MTKKFRVWDKQDKSFLSKEYLKEFKVSISWDGQTIRQDFWGGTKIIGENVIVQQWTGLTDSQGVEIYEGDILFHKNEKQRIKIKFHDGAFCFFGKNHPENGFVLTSSYKDEVSVIGNIFQNPELLEKC